MYNWRIKIRDDHKSPYLAILRPITCALVKLEKMEQEPGAREAHSEAEKERLQFHIRDTKSEYQRLFIAKEKYRHEVASHLETVIQECTGTLLAHQTELVKEWFFQKHRLQGISKFPEKTRDRLLR